MALDQAGVPAFGALPSVYLLDSSPGTLALVADRLDGSGQLRVVGIAANRPEMYPSVRTAEPDAVIIDRVPDVSEAAEFQAAVDGCGAKVVLHCATPPQPLRSSFGFPRVDAVVYREVGRIGELIDTVRALASARER